MLLTDKIPIANLISVSGLQFPKELSHVGLPQNVPLKEISRIPFSKIISIPHNDGHRGKTRPVHLISYLYGVGCKRTL